MEEGLVALKSIPPEFSKVTEKSREKERRLRVREENLEALRREQEERRVRSLERARVNPQLHKYPHVYAATIQFRL